MDLAMHSGFSRLSAVLFHEPTGIVRYAGCTSE